MSLRGRAMRVDRAKGLGAGDVLSIQISENPDTQNL